MLSVQYTVSQYAQVTSTEALKQEIIVICWVLKLGPETVLRKRFAPPCLGYTTLQHPLSLPSSAFATVKRHGLFYLI